MVISEKEDSEEKPESLKSICRWKIGDGRWKFPREGLIF